MVQSNKVDFSIQGETYLRRWQRELFLICSLLMVAPTDASLSDQPGSSASVNRVLSDPRIAAAIERLKQRGIAPEDAIMLVNRMAASGTASAELVIVLNGLERSAVPGVPPKLLLDKALEGVAKGVPPARLVTALNTHSQRLRAAVVYVDKLAAQQWAPSAALRENTVLRLASAMSQGVSDQMVERMINSAMRSPKRERLTLPAVVTAIQVYADLVSRRVPAKQTTDIVNAGLERAWSADEFRGTVVSIDLLTSDGSPDRAANEFLQAIQQGRSPSDVVRDAQARERGHRPVGPRAGDDQRTGRKGPPTERPGPRPDRDKPGRP